MCPVGERDGLKARWPRETHWPEDRRWRKEEERVVKLEDRGKRIGVCCQSLSLQSVSAALIKDAWVSDACISCSAGWERRRHLLHHLSWFKWSDWSHAAGLSQLLYSGTSASRALFNVTLLGGWSLRLTLSPRQHGSNLPANHQSSTLLNAISLRLSDGVIGRCVQWLQMGPRRKAWDLLVFFNGVWMRRPLGFMFMDSSACVVTLMLWLVGQRAFDDMLNEWSDGAAQQGEGGDLPHQTLTPVSLSSPTHSLSFPQELRKTSKKSMISCFKYFYFFRVILL